MNTVENKKYQIVNISEDPSLFSGYLGDLVVDIDILRRLSKDLGFSYELYLELHNLNPESAESLVRLMSIRSSHVEISLLIDIKMKVVIGYSLDTERVPLLNSEFIKRVNSLTESCDALHISEWYYMPDDTISSILIKKNDPIIVEEKYEGKDSNLLKYQIGVLITNDELNSAYSRLVLYVEGQPLYLPASMYNTTTSRYKRSTSNSIEALEVLVLKVVDDLRENELQSKLYEFHFRYRANKNISASYEEYSNVLRVMRKIPSIIEDNSYLEKLLSKYDDFEKKYIRMDDQKSSYIWRCTAMSDITVGALVSITTSILNELSAPSVEYLAIRDLLGAYISTNRIADEIAKESI